MSSQNKCKTCEFNSSPAQNKCIPCLINKDYINYKSILTPAQLVAEELLNALIKSNETMESVTFPQSTKVENQIDINKALIAKAQGKE